MTGSLPLRGLLHHVRDGGGIRVEARADVLQIDDDRVEPLQHVGRRALGRAVQRVDRQAGLLVARRGTASSSCAADAVLGAEQRDELHAGRAGERVDRRLAAARAPGLVRQQPDALALERREALGLRARRCRRASARADGAAGRSAAAVGRGLNAPRDGRGPARDVRGRRAAPRPRWSRRARAAASRRPCRRDARGSTGRSRSSSTRDRATADVPVNPVWPYDPIGNSSPRFAENDESMSQPRPRTSAMPAGVAGDVISATVAGDRMRTRAERARRRAACGSSATDPPPSENSPACPATPPIRRAVGSWTTPRRNGASGWLHGHASGRQRWVGAMRALSDAGGRNIVSAIPSGSKTWLRRVPIDPLAAHALDDAAEQEEVDVAVEEARAGRRDRHLLDRAPDRFVRAA